MNKRQKAIRDSMPTRKMTAAEWEYATDDYKELRKNKKMIYVIIKCPCHEEGALKLIDWAKGDDGFSVTRTHKGFKHIELLVGEDNKTLWLYEQWETKEDHQAYLGFRMENGFEDFMKEILEAEFSLSYLTNAGA